MGKDFDTTLADISINKIIKVNAINKDTVKTADLIMDNKLYLLNGLELLEYDENFDWNYQHHNSSNTYQLYIQTLNFIGYLLNAFEVTKDNKYKSRAVEIFYSWYRFYKADTHNEMIWYDHPAAARAINLVYLSISAINSLPIQKEEFISLLIEHAEYLYKDDNHRKHNHGIMMDRALVQLGLYIIHNDSERWVEKAISRMKETFYCSFSDLCIHLENSPAYHKLTQNLYYGIEAFLNKNQRTLGEDLLKRLELSNNYFNFLTKPDGFTPLIGDSQAIGIGIANKEYGSFNDSIAGITILQSKNQLNPLNSTWISFVCGYGTTTHKHFDDLSINLFYNGKDIFIDSGKYNYGNSPIRGYVKSAKAHNSISLRNKNYKLQEPSVDRNYIKTISFMTNGNIDIVQGINNGYGDVNLKRTLIFLKPDILCIIDEIMSQKNKEFSQIFNLAPHISEIYPRKNNVVEFLSGEDKIEIVQINPIDNVFVKKGNDKIPEAIISEKFEKVTFINQIEFVKLVKKDAFITVIKLGENARLRFKEIRFDIDTRQLSIKLREMDLKFII